jgi:hypothetical protein
MMTRRDRDDLVSIARQREKHAKTAAEKHGAEMKAQFEKDLAAIYHYDQREVWKQAHALAEAAVEKARREIAEESKKLGIPSSFAPDLGLLWYGRGENAVTQRRTELRRVAYSRIDVLVREAKLKIEAQALEIRTQLIAGGLETAEARAFLEKMPTPAELFPPSLSVDEVRQLAKMPELLQ